MVSTQRSLKQQLITDGYCVARQCLQPSLVQQLQRWSSEAIGCISEDHRRSNRSQGSLINLSDYEEFADVIGCAQLARLFTTLEFVHPIFSSGYIISKPPGGPPLFWHQDWWGWDDPLSYTEALAQVFIMIYLAKTSTHNGCLRVIPGSHRRPHPLHSAKAAHGEVLSRVDNPDDPLYQSLVEEVNVEVEPGDVVVGDARILHGAHANQSNQERTLLTLWYHPDYPALPSGMRARIMEIFLRRDVDTDPDAAGNKVITDWPANQRAKVDHLLPTLNQAATPHAWNREPDLSRFSV